MLYTQVVKAMLQEALENFFRHINIKLENV